VKQRSELEILVVDDIKGMRDNIMANLKELKLCKFTEASSVDEAILLLKEKAIDMIVSEWAMTPREGIDILKFIRQNPKLEKIPFIFTSSFYEQRHLNEAINYKVNSFIIKPYDDDLLVRNIDILLKKFFTT